MVIVFYRSLHVRPHDPETRFNVWCMDPETKVLELTMLPGPDTKDIYRMVHGP